MGKALSRYREPFKIRSGRARGSLEGIEVDYYGVGTPLNQIASIPVEDGNTLLVSPWEKPLEWKLKKPY